MPFRIVGPLKEVEVIAKGRQIRVLKQLIQRHGKGSWRKMKAFAIVQHQDGKLTREEVHYYEAHGVGRRGFKIKP